jgi:hypothetical protein
MTLSINSAAHRALCTEVVLLPLACARKISLPRSYITTRRPADCSIFAFCAEILQRAWTGKQLRHEPHAEVGNFSARLSGEAYGLQPALRPEPSTFCR